MTESVLARIGYSVRSVIVIVLAAALLGGAVAVADRSESATPPYDGPLDAGAAVGALECEGKTPYERGAGIYDDGLAQVQESAEAALDNYQRESGLFSVPRDGYAVERETDREVLLSYDVSGRTKVALFVANSIRDWNGDRGWGIRAWAQCDPSEFPPDVTDELNIGVWEDESGRRVPITRIQSFQGAEHCSWTDITFLRVGRKQRRLVRARHQGRVLRAAPTTFASDATLPARATRACGATRQLWIGPDKEAAYLVSLDDRRMSTAGRRPSNALGAREAGGVTQICDASRDGLGPDAAGGRCCTGVMSLFAGRSSDAWVFAVHGAGGFALGGMLVWKGRRVLRRLVRPWDRRTAAGAGAAAFVAVALLSGWAWSSGFQLSFAGYNLLGWHFALGTALALVVLGHALLRGKPLRRADIAGRRQFLSLGAVALGAYAAWWVQRPVGELLGLRGAQRRFTGSNERARPAGTTSPLPRGSPTSRACSTQDEWRLEITGRVARPLELTLGELDAGDELIATLVCTGGFYSRQRWRGSRLRLLSRARPLGAASTCA